MELGVCKMCLLERQLIQSHLIPRGVYDLCKTADSDPVKISSTLIMQTSRQTRDYLLCQPCDNLLNKHGETWLLPKLKTWDQGFPLFDIISKVAPDVIDGDVVGYAASRNPEINVEAITHFGMGIFWKAAVHSWVKEKGDPRIELGPYSDQIRQFLRSDAPFPDNVILNVGVVPPEFNFSNATDPYRGSSEGLHNYVFNVPGVQFVLTIGKTMSKGLRDTCFYSNPHHPIIVTDLSESMKDIYKKQSAKAYKSPKLLKYLADKKATSQESLKAAE